MCWMAEQMWVHTYLVPMTDTDVTETGTRASNLAQEWIGTCIYNPLFRYHMNRCIGYTILDLDSVGNTQI